LGRGADARQHLGFLRRCRRQPVAVVAREANAAGRAAAATAADRGVGNAGDAADLEDREAGGLSHAATVAVVETHHAGAPLPEIAQGARGDRRGQEGERRVFEPGRDRIEVGDLLGSRNMGALEQAFEEAGTLRQLGDVAQRDGGAGKAGGGDQQGEAIEEGQPVAVPGLEAQREMQADTAMHPDDEGQGELSQNARPAAGDERSQHPRIPRLDVVERLREARAHDMDHAQRDGRCAEDPLRPFPARQFQRAPTVQRPQREEEVTQQRPVEKDLADGIVPDEGEPVPPFLEDAQRDQAERVIEEMGDDVDEEDVARPEAKPPGHGVISGEAGRLRPAGRSRRERLSRRSDAAAGRGARRSRPRSAPW